MPSLRARIATLNLRVPGRSRWGAPINSPVALAITVDWKNYNEFTQRLKMEGASKTTFNKRLRGILRARAEHIRQAVQNEIFDNRNRNAPLSPATEAIYAARRQLRHRGYRDTRGTGLGRSGVDRGYSGPGALMSGRPLVRTGKMVNSIVVRDRSAVGRSMYSFEIGPTPSAKTASGLPIRDLIAILEHGYHVAIPSQAGVKIENTPYFHPRLRLLRGLFGASTMAGTSNLTGMPRHLTMPPRRVLDFPKDGSPAARLIELQLREELRKLFAEMGLPVNVFMGGG